MIRILLLTALLACPLAEPGPQAGDFCHLHHNGRVLDYALLLPRHFDPNRSYPVLLALPPGNQSGEMVQAGLRLYWADEAAKRDWVVISPVAPAGESFFTGAEGELPSLLDEVAKEVRFEGGKAHLAGVSNGGLSAYRVATEYSDRFLSLTVLPGVPPDDRAFRALRLLKGMRVAAFVGADDSSWVRGSRDAKAEMDRVGIENTLEVLPGEGHVVRLSPTKLFDLLDQRRATNRGLVSR